MVMWCLRQGSLRVQIVAILPPTASFLIASGGVAIDFDRTVLVQMVLFVFLMLVLSPLLFRPLMRLFEERENRTEGTRDDAREMQQMAAEMLTRYEDELSRVQQVAATEREKLRTETLNLEAKILEEARAATTTIVENGRKHVEVDVARIREALEQQTNQISQQIARRVLGREVD
jgi:F-type H+-transporting ATPase subunit b